MKLIAILSWSVFLSINHIYNELQGLPQIAYDAEQTKTDPHQTNDIIVVSLGR